MWVEWSVKNGENKYRAPIHSVWLQNHGGFFPFQNWGALTIQACDKRVNNDLKLKIYEIGNNCSRKGLREPRRRAS